jgi:hypothetical protein
MRLLMQRGLLAILTFTAVEHAAQSTTNAYACILVVQLQPGRSHEGLTADPAGVNADSGMMAAPGLLLDACCRRRCAVLQIDDAQPTQCETTTMQHK